MILDLMMPEVDGFQVLKSIRNVEKTAQLPVLILTAKHVTVEDNPDNVTTIRALLEESFEITTATDGKDGLAKAKEQDPALILLDISLPVMDGFQVLKQLR